MRVWPAGGRVCSHSRQYSLAGWEPYYGQWLLRLLRNAHRKRGANAQKGGAVHRLFHRHSAVRKRLLSCAQDRRYAVASRHHGVLHRIADRILNEVRGVNQVTYDITSKSRGIGQGDCYAAIAIDSSKNVPRNGQRYDSMTV